jgi:putative transposase
MKYNPAWHNRRSLRLKGFDYASPGSYFVTICVSDMGTFPFGCVVDGTVRLSAFGEITEDCWRQIPAHFPGVEIDAHVVMPNHIHGIVVIKSSGKPRPAGTRYTSSIIHPRPVFERPETTLRGPGPGSLGAVMGSFKAAVSRRVNKMNHTPGVTVWQERYHERIIRTESSLERVRRYIRNNPVKWGRKYR